MFQFLIGIINQELTAWELTARIVSIPHRYYKSETPGSKASQYMGVSIPHRYYKSELVSNVNAGTPGFNSS